MDTTTERTKDLLHLQCVPRWCVIPVARSQSVAEHSFRVAVITGEICDRMAFYNMSIDRAKALWWAVIHDATECYTGDIPAPFKRGIQDVGCSLTDDWQMKEEDSTGTKERDVVRLADSIEAFDYIIMWGITPTHQIVAQDIYTNLEARLTAFVDQYKSPEMRHVVADLIRRAGASEPPTWIQNLAPKTEVASTGDGK